MLHPRFRPAPLALALALACGSLAAVPVWSATEIAPVQLRIAAQPLAQALNDWARQTGLELMVQPSQVAGKTAPAVTGRLTPQQALDRLLAGSGLEGKISGTAAVVRPAAASQVTTLPAITVAGSTGLAAERINPPTTVGSKTPLTQREIPQSVTVISQDQIQQQHMQTLNDAVRYAPGITVTHGDSDRYSYYARGFPIDTWLIDGVPTTQNLSSVPPDLIMYDRVEVLSGPDGLLNGFGSPGGAINLVRKRAPGAFATTMDLYGGTSNRIGGDVDIGGPLNETGTLRGRVVASDEYQHLMPDTTWRRDKTFYGTLEADITPSTTVQLGLGYNRIDQKQAWDGLPIYASTYTPVNLGRSAYVGAPWNHNSSEVTTAFASVEQKLANNWKAKLSFNHMQSNYSVLDESIFSAVTDDDQAMYASDRLSSKDQQDAVDLFVDGPFSLFGREHHLTFGGSYERESLKQKNNYCSASDNARLGGSGNFCDITASIYSVPSAEPAFDGPVFGRTTITNQYGLYGNARFSLADPLTLVTGARVTWWNDTFNPVASENPFGASHYRYNISGKVTPYAGLIYDLNNNYSVYASYTGIFVPQNETDESGNLIKPLEGEQYELGIKGEYFGGRLNTSVALFQLTEKNRAMSDPRYPNEGYYVAAGKARSKGIELKVSGNITPAWTVFAGYTYADANYLDSSTNPDGLSFSQTTPKHLFKLWTNYRLPGKFSKFSVGGGTFVTSGISASDGIGTIKQGGYATVDLRLGYQISKQLSASLNVTNLFDRKYYESVTTGSVMWGTDRQVLLNLRYAM